MIFRSITYAQRAKHELEQQGYSALLTQPPAGMSKKGCAHAIRIDYNYLNIASSICQRAGIRISSAYLVSSDGSYTEVGI